CLTKGGAEESFNVHATSWSCGTVHCAAKLSLTYCSRCRPVCSQGCVACGLRGALHVASPPRSLWWIHPDCLRRTHDQVPRQDRRHHLPDRPGRRDRPFDADLLTEIQPLRTRTTAAHT